MTPVLDLCLFHTMERNLYKHLIDKLGVDPEFAKQSIALWLWLESIGHYDLIRYIYAHPDMLLGSLVNEAQACIQCLHPSSALPIHDPEIPYMATLINEPINLRFFQYHRDVAARGITKIVNSVCNIIFDDDLMTLAGSNPNHPANQMVISAGLIKPFGEGSSWEGASLGIMSTVSTHAPSSSRTPLSVVQQQQQPMEAGLGGGMFGSPSLISTLNPQARPWAPGQDPPQEDQRSMFITFSRGYPLKREEIIDFFTTRWGNCIESLMIEKTEPSIQPMFGKVIFNSLSVISQILNGQDKAKFVIKGKHLWARMFVPKRH